MAGAPVTGIPEAQSGCMYSALARTCGDQTLPIWGPEHGLLFTANSVVLLRELPLNKIPPTDLLVTLDPKNQLSVHPGTPPDRPDRLGAAQ